MASEKQPESQEGRAGPRDVTPLELVGVGATVLALGAVAGFFGQQAGTAKKLAEEGIDPRSRLRFLPVAVRRRRRRRCLLPAARGPPSLDAMLLL